MMEFLKRKVNWILLFLALVALPLAFVLQWMKENPATQAVSTPDYVPGDIAKMIDDAQRSGKKEVTIILDPKAVLSRDAIAALPLCTEVALIEPAKGSTAHCRTPEGTDTLVSNYWEVHYMTE